MSIAEKLTTIAENVPKVYEAGQKSEYDRFWDTYQQNGNITNCNKLFSGYGWNNETFKPKYDIKPTDAYGLFWNSQISGDLVEILENIGISLDFRNVVSQTNLTYLFGATRFTRIGIVDLSNAKDSLGNAGEFGQLFWNSSSLVTVDKLIVNGHGFTNLAFNACSKLENLTIEGTIGKNSIFNACSKLSHDSLMSIINALKDYSKDTSGTTWKVTLGSTNLAKLTDDEKAIATDKGWTLA